MPFLDSSPGFSEPLLARLILQSLEELALLESDVLLENPAELARRFVDAVAATDALDELPHPQMIIERACDERARRLGLSDREQALLLEREVLLELAPPQLGNGCRYRLRRPIRGVTALEPLCGDEPEMMIMRERNE